MTHPLPNYRFQVSLDPSGTYRPAAAPDGPRVVLAGAFSDVTGLSGELEVLAQPEGGMNGFVHQLPVRMSWGRLVLKRGIVLDPVLWTWFARGRDGAFGSRRDGEVTVVDPSGLRSVGWAFRGGLAAKWTGPDLSAREGGVALETLEIVHQGLWPVA